MKSVKVQYRGPLAQSRARAILAQRHKEEYQVIYREEMMKLGGKPHPAKEQKIKSLEEQLKRLRESQ